MHTQHKLMTLFVSSTARPLSFSQISDILA